jgi:hypothetical protein
MFMNRSAGAGSNSFLLSNGNIKCEELDPSNNQFDYQVDSNYEDDEEDEEDEDEDFGESSNHHIDDQFGDRNHQRGHRNASNLYNEQDEDQDQDQDQDQDGQNINNNANNHNNNNNDEDEEEEERFGSLVDRSKFALGWYVICSNSSFFVFKLIFMMGGGHIIQQPK